MMYYAVIDTNVVVSALLKAESTPGDVVAEALHGSIIPLLNDQIIAEYADVLKRPKFHFDHYVIDVFLDELEKRAAFVEAAAFDEYIPDSKDTVFYAVLMGKRNEGEAWLVTGNLRHFPAKAFVVTPREMINIIRGAE